MGNAFSTITSQPIIFAMVKNNHRNGIPWTLDTSALSFYKAEKALMWILTQVRRLNFNKPTNYYDSRNNPISGDNGRGESLKSVTESCSISFHIIIFNAHRWSHSAFGYVKLLTVMFWFYYILFPNPFPAKSLCVSSSDTWTHSNRSDTAYMGPIASPKENIACLYLNSLMCCLYFPQGNKIPLFLSSLESKGSCMAEWTINH